MRQPYVVYIDNKQIPQKCVDLDEALEVASKNPGATFGILELRPFADS
jgi:hypothetical protein